MRAWLDLPRVALADLPTPLERLDRFGDAIGAEVWIKRDDVGSFGLAGNKVRKLEYVLADARGQGADTIVIIGAAQSNACRATAAACARLGLRCVLVLSGDEPDAATGNLLLDKLFGAELRFAGTFDWAELWQASQDVTDELRDAGARPHSLPAGSSSPLGAVGFVAAWFELLDDLRGRGVDAGTLWHASSSGGTHAGLLLGRSLSDGGPELRAIGVAPDIVPDMPGFYAGLANGAAELLGTDARVQTSDVALDMSFLGEGYAIPTAEGNDAIRLLARTEAIACDPIYSGKALAALVAAARAGDLGGMPAVFWHTGGHHALFDPRFGDAVV
jgi:D-cysteine desulfhydrase family pyridoxal phosphate-dependent enzyme